MSYVVNTLSERSCRRWFSHFNFSLKAESREDQPNGLDSDDLEAAVTVSPVSVARQLSEPYNCLIQIEKDWKVFSRWTIDLSPDNHQQHVDCCDSLLNNIVSY